MLGMLRFRRPSDADHIERIAKQVAFWDRWRVAMWILFVLVLLVVLSMSAWSVWLLNSFAAGQQANKVAGLFAVVAAFFGGAALALNLSGFFYYVGHATLGEYRTERLLIRLNGEVSELKKQIGSSSEVRAPIEVQHSE